MELQARGTVKCNDKSLEDCLTILKLNDKSLEDCLTILKFNAKTLTEGSKVNVMLWGC